MIGRLSNICTYKPQKIPEIFANVLGVFSHTFVILLIIFFICIAFPKLVHIRITIFIRRYSHAETTDTSLYFRRIKFACFAFFGCIGTIWSIIAILKVERRIQISMKCSPLWNPNLDFVRRKKNTKSQFSVKLLFILINQNKLFP